MIELLPLLAILVSAIGAVIIVLIGERNPNLREATSVIAGVLKFSFVCMLIPPFLRGETIGLKIATILPGIELSFRVDGLGLLFAFGASFLWILTTFYSIGYMRTLREHAQTRYFTCFALSLSSAIGIAFAANLFTMFIFYEALTIVTYPLVAHHEDREGLEGGRQYIVYLLGTAKIFLFAAIVITYILTGTLDFRKGGIFAPEIVEENKLILQILLILFIYGFNKSAVMPLHSWLPAAMVAPTPVSALLHAVAVVKAGVFTVSRVLLNIYGEATIKAIGMQDLIFFLTGFTIIMGSLIALTRDDFKARLAFSTVANLSYIIIGVAMFSPLGIMGGLIHISMHAFSKITMFFVAGSVYVSTHVKRISELDGIGKVMPITMFSFFLATLSMIGIPLFAGFISKYNLAMGALQIGRPELLGIFIASSFLNAVYFLPISYKAFFRKPLQENRWQNVKENYFCAIPLLITALFTIILGVYPDFLMEIIRRVMQ
ncbi:MULTISPECIES: monovalent cation/H+ antiporter subunit D family protein [Thermodesulfovibrio]|uniref:NADH dehydrogenase i l subunit n=1 Tax=Thermodesulfovibrio yellowstonii (strain ATCC 51303 / DSM 11347 / YP87) TaxID=289376 RepID=B5YL27_THEYD|nr:MULTISPECIES: monovalent cation/H+ antiporter subunit D family protein [Thermodesulfovibrio]ACI21251.1 NADH dehydrogenase i l subunit [Thermodesulfovibrio yellowstonii DSM 11347]MDI6864119.1 monovalent cation/H+ antiporter subunit D family protein [Thermodesulfovibrio yellowstonii]